MTYYYLQSLASFLNVFLLVYSLAFVFFQFNFFCFVKIKYQYIHSLKNTKNTNIETQCNLPIVCNRKAKRKNNAHPKT